jgi:hypothetical protein
MHAAESTKEALHGRVLVASVVVVQMAWGASLVYLGLRFL